MCVQNETHTRFKDGSKGSFVKAFPHASIPPWKQARAKCAVTVRHHYRSGEGTRGGGGRSALFPDRLCLVGFVGEIFI